MKTRPTGPACLQAPPRFQRNGAARIAALLCIAAALATASAAARAEDRKPNIVVLLADDLGWGELGCQGSKDISTPNVDALAREGTRFTNAYVSCPVCSPTRAGFLTGRYQQRFGHEFNPGPQALAQAGFGLPLTEKTLADRLKAAGYATGMVGKWHLGYEPPFHPTKRGFDEFFGFLAGAHNYVPGGNGPSGPILRGETRVEEPEYLTDAFAREACDFIERHKSAPFFLYLPFNAVHAPLQGGKYMARFKSIADPKRRTFAGMLSAMDDAVGKVMAKIKEAGVDEDTLVFFFSDNGGPTRQTTSNNGVLRGFKGQIYEGGIRIPFIVRWKGHLPEAKESEVPVISLDIAPTALVAAGVEPPADAHYDGASLMPLLKGEAPPPGQPHHAQLYWRYGEQSAIRKGDWKLDCWTGFPSGLYDLKADISEKNDLAAKRPEVVKELEKDLNAWKAQLAEPKWTRAGVDDDGDKKEDAKEGKPAGKKGEIPGPKRQAKKKRNRI